MKFKTRSCSSNADKAYKALEFLREAYSEGKLNDIENMKDVFDALDISEDLEFAYRRLRDYHIDL